MNGQPIACDCGHTVTVPEGNGGTGYGMTPDGKTICYACCHKRDVEELKDRSKPFVGYVSGDRQHITNWPGGQLMAIATSHMVPNPFGGTLLWVRARDVHGQWWSGKGTGAGMIIRLHPRKH